MRRKQLNTALKKARLAKGMTQKRLASLIGLTIQGYWDIENGRSNGSVKTWDRLEAVLGVDQKILRQIDKESS